MIDDRTCGYDRPLPDGDTREDYAAGTDPCVIAYDDLPGDGEHVPATEMVSGMFRSNNLDPGSDHDVVPELHRGRIEYYAIGVDPETLPEPYVRTDVAVERGVDADLRGIRSEQLVEYHPPLGCRCARDIEPLTETMCPVHGREQLSYVIVEVGGLDTGSGTFEEIHDTMNGE